MEDIIELLKKVILDNKYEIHSKIKLIIADKLKQYYPLEIDNIDLNPYSDIILYQLNDVIMLVAISKLHISFEINIGNSHRPPHIIYDTRHQYYSETKKGKIKCGT